MFVRKLIVSSFGSQGTVLSFPKALGQDLITEVKPFMTMADLVLYSLSGLE